MIFPGGTENGLEIKKSLQYCKEVKLFSASSSIPNQALYVYENNFIVSDVRKGNWLQELNAAVNENKIDIIIPANSVIIDFLNIYREKINCDILLPESDIIKITRSKKRTLELLKDVIETPCVYESKESIDNCCLPVFVKPDNGYGAQGAFCVDTLEKLKDIDFEYNIVEEYLPGKEYTIDCFSDESDILFCRGRERKRIRMGTTMHCEELSEDIQKQFGEIAKKIRTKIPILGYWFFQVKEGTEGKLKLLEIDVRIAGTMAYHRCKGINFPLLALYQHYGYKIDICTNEIELVLDRCLKNTFKLGCEYECVYIDLDDTIICKDKINIQIIQFLYQCINENKKIILLSKNENRDSYLKERKLYHIFTERNWLREEESKASYIKEKNAIFIDDSFSQRKEVHERCKIPTFDASMVECLLHEKI